MRIESPADVTADAIDQAAEILTGVVRRTPLERSHRLSEIAGRNVFLKREDLQSVRSYKIRGAYLFVAGLEPEQRTAGVVTASAGNHAQGVAFACNRLKIQGRIYVPTRTPKQKRERILAIGGEWVQLVLTGDTFDDAAEAAHTDAERTGATMVPPFDDPTVITGQGTVVREAVAQAREQFGSEIGTVVVPVGGGGLIAGTGAWLRERMPSVRLVGVEPAGAVSMATAVRQGKPVTLAEIDSFIDGAAVRRAGRANLELVDRIAPELIAIEEGAVCTEMLNLYQVEGIIAEPAGALAATAVATRAVPGEATAEGQDPSAAARPEGEADGDILVVVSGGNNDVSRYNEVVERSLVHEGLKHYFLVTFAQEPGALRRFLDQVLGEGDDIVLFDYIKRNNREQGPALVGIELGARENLEPLLARIATSNMPIERIDPMDPMYRYLT
ncbi:threonine ammonia-lyase IlvA [Helcobacillus massiliensis]|uniref:L-threonine dehydratase n=1 Tax=Helcobacillus massiliensis TaxID=521392 RepID=A0A839R0U1_9MICO|nr:threonine dehydratase [Helcobacillus massiliensis]